MVTASAEGYGLVYRFRRIHGQGQIAPSLHLSVSVWMARRGNRRAASRPAGGLALSPGARRRCRKTCTTMYVTQSDPMLVVVYASTFAATKRTFYSSRAAPGSLTSEWSQLRPSSLGTVVSALRQWRPI